MSVRAARVIQEIALINDGMVSCAQSGDKKILKVFHVFVDFLAFETKASEKF